MLKIVKDLCETGDVEYSDEHSFLLDENIEALNYFGINSISQLDLILKEKSEKIVRFFVKWNEDGIGGGVIEKGVVTFYLFYVLVYENYSEEILEEYLPAYNVR